ncbi:helix-turn-helix domain-containing protein [Actinomadura alba]|uniref:Helix-turn-helix domain-containing protein n=3 Tax=Actinomadura alba TaxID=406431 RepID=A0ABR7M383_9ACTN|nr:helix-turn-helix domain-containing protein [Actinomadura alba]
MRAGADHSPAVRMQAVFRGVGPGVAVSAEVLLYTPEQAAELLGVKPSWLRRKAAARAVPCTFVGKHLRFSRADLEAIVTAGEQTPRALRPRA